MRVTFSLLAAAAVVNAAGVLPGQIKNLVTFGDSYTDVVNVGDGGTAWPVYAAGYAKLSLFPFARSGATCSNNITFRPFPPLFESQLPTYFAEVENKTLKLDSRKTIYTLWIGTNDVGSNALLTGSDKATVVDTTRCAVNWVKVLYESGARNFLFQNMIPLQLVPMYSAAAYPNRFWNAPFNATEWSVFMTELTTAGNAIAELLLQNLARTLPGAHIGLFDSHSLFQDMFNRPSAYLNGTAPLNVTGAVNACVFPEQGQPGDPFCTVAQGTDRDSFLWYVPGYFVA
ncbi:hypothetical protein HGRIS_014628 [Hohenbuehelia grisea]|uniref:Carbohydrate esterase family 16 protein n=1 Tax=Hohenbuehelia grisea TaxID=104357 RepID=A0ABR3JU16_9AGAR